MICLDYFYYLLGRRDYSVGELSQKGKEKGYELEEIEKAIAHLQELGYQSDRRLVENLISTSQRKYGKSAIKRKCLQRQIPSAIFDQIWDAQQAEAPSEDQNALAELKAKVMRKYKVDDFQNLDNKTYKQICGFLQYRGFNPFEVLAQWRTEEAEVESF